MAPQMTRREYHLRTKYGLTLSAYNELDRRGHGKCWICERPPKTLPLNVDHDHQSGQIRGLLCFRCNKFLMPWMSADWLTKAIDYVSTGTLLYVPQKKRKKRRTKWQAKSA